MPAERYLSLIINNTPVDLPDITDDLGFRIDYTLEEPENFMSKQGAAPQPITLPATKNNDQIFNTFHNPKVEDAAPDGAITGSSIASGGSGAVVGEIFTILGTFGTFARGTITSVSLGVVTGYALGYLGTGYPEGTNVLQTVCTLNGVGFTLNVTALASASFRELMPCVFNVNGTVPVLIGYALLTDAVLTDKPESYDVTLYSANGQWVIDMQNITLWDCLNTAVHTFNVGVVEGSWANFNSTEFNDFVYAPVRYRQPFDGTTIGYQGDNAVNIYHLRPSISLYWLIVRAFRQIGYSINSQFFQTQYFQNLVLPWVWGDFYDINSQLVEGIGFKVVGELPNFQTEPVPNDYSNIPFWFGMYSSITLGLANIGSPGGSVWNYLNMALGGWNPGAYLPGSGEASLTNGIQATGGVYVMDHSGTSSGGNDFFHMDIVNPPDGYDNFMLYSFDVTTGTMQYHFNPPASLAGNYVNVSMNFTLSLYCVLQGALGAQALIGLECVHIPLSGPIVTTCTSILPGSGAIFNTTYPAGSNFSVATVYTTTIPFCNPGDTLKFRLRILSSTSTGAAPNFFICSGGYLNNNPNVIGVPSYAYDPVTQRFGFITPNSIWSPLQSSLSMTGFLLQLGNTVNFKNYDAFRQHNFLDMLGGIVDLFNLEIQSDNINRTVTIEPMFGSTLPTGEVIDGYFSTTRILDWTAKRDILKGFGSRMSLFNSSERQLDLTFKNDGNDGGQNIWSQRYKGIFTSNRTYSGGAYQNNLNIENGIIAGVPGSSRYILPNRFAKGNKQMTNRFFSAVMHCLFPQWQNLNGASNPAPQLICIFPESSGGSSEAITQSFEPKLAYYGGQRHAVDVGRWIWIGDPAFPNVPGNAARQSGSFKLPMMFAVNYVQATTDPILSYCDENITGTTTSKGLMSQFYLQRFAIMRNGQLLTTNLRLNLNDVCNWEHQECIMIDGCLYALIQIQGYNPLTDEPTACTMWKVVNPEQIDVESSYPSALAILANPQVLPTIYDLRYAPLMLYPTDLPQIS